MRMLCTIKTVTDGLSNETICEMTGVEQIEFLRKQMLQRQG